MPLTKTDNSAMTSVEISMVQSALDGMGYEPGPIDGIMGPRTESVIIAFKRARGLKPRAYVGPITWETLFGDHTPLTQDPIPWTAEAGKVMRLHEVYDNGLLKEWLSSDGHALGDPAKLPWCGDFVETAIRLSLPHEWIPQNPYWALNWRKFGVPTKPTYGAIASIKRKGGGHVGFIIGQDDKRYYMMGGNQSNRVSVAPVDKSRFEPESFRWPSTAVPRPIYLPRLESDKASNTNES